MFWTLLTSHTIKRSPTHSNTFNSKPITIENYMVDNLWHDPNETKCSFGATTTTKTPFQPGIASVTISTETFRHQYVSMYVCIYEYIYMHDICAHSRKERHTILRRILRFLKYQHDFQYRTAHTPRKSKNFTDDYDDVILWASHQRQDDQIVVQNDWVNFLESNQGFPQNFFVLFDLDGWMDVCIFRRMQKMKHISWPHCST
jgi:hypothetical protein